MTAFLWKNLILQLHGASAGTFNQAHCALGVDGVSKTGINIDDKRQVTDLGDGRDRAGKFAQGDKADVRRPKMGVRNAGAGHIHSIELLIGNHPRGQRISRPGDDHRLTPIHQFTKFPATISKFFHQNTPPVTGFLCPPGCWLLSNNSKPRPPLRPYSSAVRTVMG